MLDVEIDLHCHLLPAWDDGPPDEASALALARQMSQAGIRFAAVTPHVGHPSPYERRGRQEPPPQSIAGAVTSWQEKLDAAAIPLQLVPGAELTFHESDLPLRVAREPHLSYGGAGKYLLIESTFGMWPRFADSLLYELALVGVTPVIAHPERLPDVQSNPRLLEPAVRGGAVLQITARSLTSPDDRKSGRCARELVELGLAGIVASDAHRDGAVLPAASAPEIVRIAGEAEAQRLLVENPRRVLSGKAALPGALPSRDEPRVKRSWLGRLRGSGPSRG